MLPLLAKVHRVLADIWLSVSD